MKRVQPRTGVRDRYAREGVKGYYEKHAADYKNPHEAQVRELIKRNEDFIDYSHVLDLACGNGEVSLALQELGYANMVGLDPYTCAQYESLVHQPCLRSSFDDILQGKLEGTYSAVICSFGLHLVEKSKLSALTQQLLRLSDTLVIITPHKRPELEKCGMRVVHEDAVLTQRGKKVKLKVYRR